MNVPVTRSVAGKSLAHSHFVDALSELRQQRSSQESLQAIGAMATICSMAGGSSPREAFGASWKEDTAGEARTPRRRSMMKLKKKKEWTKAVEGFLPAVEE